MEPGYLSPITPSLLLTPGGHHWRPVQTCSLDDPTPPLLTPGGGHQNTYGWKVSSIHPTGMPLCVNFYCPPEKLLEGNVFTCICDSVHRGCRGKPTRTPTQPPTSDTPHDNIPQKEHGTRQEVTSYPSLPTHGWQAGGTHLTGTLSCFHLVYENPEPTQLLAKKNFFFQLQFLFSLLDNVNSAVRPHSSRVLVVDIEQ